MTLLIIFAIYYIICYLISYFTFRSWNNNFNKKDFWFVVAVCWVAAPIIVIGALDDYFTEIGLIKNLKYKYKLTKETKTFQGLTLYRIKALRDFGDVKKGDKGGWVRHGANLSQDGLCWIYDDAIVCECAYVCDDAKVRGNAIVSGAARISDNACVEDDASVSDGAEVRGHARLEDNVKISGHAHVIDYAVIKDDARIGGSAIIEGHARIGSNVHVSQGAHVDSVSIYGKNTVICGHAWVVGLFHISTTELIENTDDYIVFKNFWSSWRYFVWYRRSNKWQVGCFYGTGEELIEKAYGDSEEKGWHYEQVVRYVENVLKHEEEIKFKENDDCNGRI